MYRIFLLELSHILRYKSMKFSAENGIYGSQTRNTAAIVSRIHLHILIGDQHDNSILRTVHTWK